MGTCKTYYSPIWQLRSFQRQLDVPVKHSSIYGFIFVVFVLSSLFQFHRRLHSPYISLSFSFRHCSSFTAVSIPLSLVLVLIPSLSKFHCRLHSPTPRSRPPLNSNSRLTTRHAVLPLCTNTIMYSTNMGQTPNAIISCKPAVSFGLQPVCA